MKWVPTKVRLILADQEYRFNAFYYTFVSKPVSEEKAYEHTLVLNSHGRAKHTMVYVSNIIPQEKTTKISKV